MTRVLRSWSMGPGPMCMTNWYCPIYCNPFVMPWSRAHLCIQSGEVSETGEAPEMAKDNGLYLSMIRVLRSWSMGPGPMCTTKCYCPIYCKPYVMCWSGAHCCYSWLTCSRWVMGLKEVVILLMSSCGCIVVQQFLHLSWVLARKALDTVGPHIPLFV